MDAVKKSIITLGGGCFWCTEAVFRRVIGVSNVRSGYANGKVPNPTYAQVCSGESGHAEVIQFDFDSSVIQLPDILRIFFTVHDPTTKNRQGADTGTQYRSVILYSDEKHRDVSHEIIKEVNESKAYANPIVTIVEPLQKFYPAENDHQNFYNLNTTYGYCRAVIDPKLKKFLAKHKEFVAN